MHVRLILMLMREDLFVKLRCLILISLISQRWIGVLRIKKSSRPVLKPDTHPHRRSSDECDLLAELLLSQQRRWALMLETSRMVSEGWYSAYKHTAHEKCAPMILVVISTRIHMPMGLWEYGQLARGEDTNGKSPIDHGL